MIGKIIGKFRVYVGDKCVAKGKNKWTRYMASSMICWVGMKFGERNDGRNVVRYCGGMASRHYARAGNDTNTPTNPSMSDLASKIDIAPDSLSSMVVRSEDRTTYESRYKYVWNPGTIPEQTIGEFGVFAPADPDNWTSPEENPTPDCPSITSPDVAFPYHGTELNPIRMIARIASADGAFSSFYYTSEESLSLEWYVVITFGY